MDKKTIEEKLKDEKLTPKQMEAATTIDKDLEIVACAGAGKTKTITLRIINLIRSIAHTWKYIISTYVNHLGVNIFACLSDDFSS